MTYEEKQARYTGYETRGKAGYLRASYGWTKGQDFYTDVLLGSKEGHFEKTKIDVKIAKERFHTLAPEFRYDDPFNDDIANEVFDFIELYELKEKEGLNPMVEGR